MLSEKLVVTVVFAHAAVLSRVLFLFSWWSSFSADKYIITKNDTRVHSGEGFWIKKSHFKLQKK